MMTRAAAVAIAMGKKPFATHCAAPMASAVRDPVAVRLKIIPLTSAATR